MKNRKTVVVAFLLVATMMLGVGFAALTDMLRIDGTVNIKHENANKVFDSKVMFDTTKVDGENEGDTIEYSSDADVATVSVNSLTVAGSTAEFYLAIVNDYQENMYATPTIDTTSALYDADLIGLSSNWLSQTHEIEAGESLEYILTVTCKETVAADTYTSFAIKFDVTDQQPDAYVAFGQTAQPQP